MGHRAASECSFETWYHNAYGPVYKAVLVISGGDTTSAEDATSEAFARALEKWETVRKKDSATAWTITVAMNIEKRRMRRRVRESQLLNKFREVPSRSPISMSPETLEAVNRLGKQQRRAIVLRYVDDMTQRQVAEVLGVAPGTVAATLSQARHRLAQDLTHQRNEHGEP